MKLILLIFIMLSIIGCTDLERIESEKLIKETTELKWSDNTKYDELFKAYTICQKHPDYQGCKEIDNQFDDVSISFKTCLANQTSLLCKNLVDVISKHQIVKVLPNTDPVVMPSHPFYITLPTKLLTVQGHNLNYRKESFDWWWKKWRLTIINATLILIFAISTLLIWKVLTLNKKEDLEEKYRKIAEMAELQRIQKQNEDMEKQKKLYLEEKIKKAKLEQMRLIAKKFEEEKNKNEKLKKLDGEKKEAAKILSAVFKQKI